MDQAHAGVRQAVGALPAPQARRAGTRRRRFDAGAMHSILLACALVALSAASGRAQGTRGGSPGRLPAPEGSAECLRCHSLPNLGYREAPTAPVRNFTVAPARFHSSAHARLACRQCHTDIDSFPHIPSAQRQRVSCGQDCHAVDSAGRPYTHRTIVAQFDESAHGGATRRGSIGGTGPDPAVPTCLTCHGSGDAHAIVPPGRMTRSSRMALCAECHDNRQLMEKHGVSAEAVASFSRSFHYKAVRFGASGTAICMDCHTSHHVLPASDPRSSVAPGHLTKTCGQAGCHAGAGRNFAVSGANHLDLRVGREPLLWFEEKFFLVLTAGTMLMLLVGIVLDVQRKFGWFVLVRRLPGVLGRAIDRLGPSLARIERRGLQLARQILID